MKNIRNKFLALLLITSVAFSSCKKEDRLSPSANNATSLNSGNAAMNKPIKALADWKISSYEVKGANQTKTFSQFLFEFSSNGILSAFSSNGRVDGTWVIGKEGYIMTINFEPLPLSQLNREWRIVNRTATQIRLEYMPTRSSVETVTFSRFQEMTETPPLN